MGVKVSHIAQLAMDAFFQDFKPATAFFTLEHFERYCVLADAKLKQDEYLLLTNNNLRARKFNAQVNLSPDNYIIEETQVKGDTAFLKNSIMQFPGPIFSIPNISAEKGSAEFMPIKITEQWQLRNLTDVIFYYPLTISNCSQIKFINLEHCKPGPIKVTYMPSLSADSTIQETRGFAIVNMVTMYLKQAKEGTVIDKSNDGNPNVSQQTEINSYLLDRLKS